MAYKLKQLEFEAIQYTGDVQALLDFGVQEVSYREFKDKHIGVSTAKGGVFCPVGAYLLKAPNGDIQVISEKDFLMLYEKV